MCAASYLFFYLSSSQNLTSMAVAERADAKGLHPRDDDSSDPTFHCRGTKEGSVTRASLIPPFIFRAGNRGPEKGNDQLVRVWGWNQSLGSQTVSAGTQCPSPCFQYLFEKQAIKLNISQEVDR